MATVPHKNAEIIKAWVDGEEVQYFSEERSEWVTVPSVSTTGNLLHLFDNKYFNFRIKPKEVVSYTIVNSKGIPGSSFFGDVQSVAESYSVSWTESQGVLKRTIADGKVVSMEFIARN